MEEQDVEKLKKKCEIWWGLSDSSTNLAKELLPTEFVSSSPSTEMSLLVNDIPSQGACATVATDGKSPFQGAEASVDMTTSDFSNEDSQEAENANQITKEELTNDNNVTLLL